MVQRLEVALGSICGRFGRCSLAELAFVLVQNDGPDDFSVLCEQDGGGLRFSPSLRGLYEALRMNLNVCQASALSTRSAWTTVFSKSRGVPDSKTCIEDQECTDFCCFARK